MSTRRLGSIAGDERGAGLGLALGPAIGFGDLQLREAAAFGRDDVGRHALGDQVVTHRVGPRQRQALVELVAADRIGVADDGDRAQPDARGLELPQRVVDAGAPGRRQVRLGEREGAVGLEFEVARCRRAAAAAAASAPARPSAGPPAPPAGPARTESAGPPRTASRSCSAGWPSCCCWRCRHSDSVRPPPGGPRKRTARRRRRPRWP